jgi:hypothetical protein
MTRKLHLKKLVLPLLLLSSLMYGQKESYFSMSLSQDIKNGIVGSAPTHNEPSLDLTLTVHCVGQNYEMNFGDELFNQIGFNRFFVNGGYHTQWYIPFRDKEYNFSVIPYVGFSSITRYGKPDHEIVTPNQTYWIYGYSNHLAVQGGLSFRAKVTDNFLIDFKTEALTRQDLKYMYPTDPNKFIVISNTIGIHYVFND